MHDIEPFWKWRDHYIAEEDRRSPFFGRKHSELYFTKKIYNYLIHPQWDGFGSSTLYIKILFVNYDDRFALIELIGEWNDALHDDVAALKRKVIEKMMDAGICHFIFFCENLLQFHSGDADYYEEWAEELREENGWAVFLNTLKHVDEEMASAKLQFYINFGEQYNDINWRAQKPQHIFEAIDALVNGQIKRLV